MEQATCGTGDKVQCLPDRGCGLLGTCMRSVMRAASCGFVLVRGRPCPLHGRHFLDFSSAPSGPRCAPDLDAPHCPSRTMHDVLPSYPEAIARPDWLQLAAPYVAITDYPALCRVNSRCWHIFAPLLWRDPCAWSKRLGRSTDDNTGRFWSRFLLRDARLLSPRTRDLIRVVDIRKAIAHFYQLLALLPNVESLLIDDFCRVNARCLDHADPSRPDRRLLMLSLENNSHGISPSLTESRHLRALVYLDISDAQWLPELRILKMRRKQLNDYRWEAWAQLLRWRLWSLDISDNELTDASVRNLTALMDGMLERWHQCGAHDQYILRPSYLIDAPPINNADGAHDRDVTPTHVRADGSTPVRPDTLNGVLDLLSRPGVSGITHLHISGNRLTADGIRELLVMLFFPTKRRTTRTYPPSLKAPKLHVSSAVRMSGLPGLGHLFRPVYSSNLRVLRIHHSLVTNIPTLTMDGLRSVECAYLAENGVFPGLEEAYPLPFLPEMNPRLQSLTLTCVPRYSFGPLIRRLAFFFRCLSLQAEALSTLAKNADAEAGRSLRLMAEEPLDIDAEELMASGGASFSFFDSPLTETSNIKPKQPRTIDLWRQMPDPPEAPPGHNPMSPDQPSSSDPERQVWVLYANVNPNMSGDTHISHSVVWAGNGWSTNPVVQGIGPATMHQTRAGAPVGCLLFHTTWRFAAMPQTLNLPPDVDSQEKVDVAAELRQRWCRTQEDYQRAMQRFPHRQYFTWDGKLEIVDPEPVDHGWLLSMDGA
ncbi:hypothetical protein M440DRAFT_1442082 [Trichoderma longibrachiatum ATCC 18648]|uniref:RNI-like protein n=1 Tax=Trichoderma longibrachiatum ATCC 18648 TaxID=983965 RepID=A0A2T4BRU9_TRILO|nr:hypothetical protein M440DRAFT_1442082 [Trichoderma longibrachiatum ATCC 18648]